MCCEINEIQREKHKKYKRSFTWKEERPKSIRNTKGISPKRWKDLITQREKRHFQN